MDKFWRKGLCFSCTSCGNCCRHEPGYVFLSSGDLSRLAAFFKMNTDQFRQQFCRTVDLGLSKRLSLTETENNDCVFWNQDCTVYKARPLQCRTYPFWPGILASPEEWERESKVCPGIGLEPLHSADEILAALKSRENDILLEN